MVKKLTAALAALALTVMLAVPCFAAEQRVFDEAGLFSETEKEELEQRIAELRDEYKYDFVILTSENVQYSDSDSEAEQYSTAYADDFYDQNGFGYGENKDGFLFFIDMSNRMPTISTCGKMIDIVNDARLEALLDASYNGLGSGDYAGACLDVLALLEKDVKAGVEEGQYEYDAGTGEHLTSPHLKLETREIAYGALGGLAAALIFVFVTKSRYSLKNSTYHYDYASNSAVDLDDTEDTYITTHITRVRRDTENRGGGGGFGGGGGGGMGSSVHTSSGGVSHGGGSGHRF